MFRYFIKSLSMKAMYRLMVLVAVLLPLSVCPSAVSAQNNDCTVPIVVTPTSPFFEDFEGGVVPDCWTQWGSSTWSVANSTSSWAWSGSYVVRISGYEQDSVSVLYSPWFDLSTMTDCRLVFMQLRPDYYSGYGMIDSLEVLVRTSPAGAWQHLAAYSAVMPNWTETSVALPAGAAACQVAFRNVCGGSYCSLDDIYIGVPLACGRVHGFSARTDTSGGVLLSWSDTANTGAVYNVSCWNFEGDTLHATTADTSLLIGNLGGCTFYHFAITASCADGSQSLPVECRLRTTSDTIHVPWYEGFDGLYGYYMPACWTTLAGHWSVQNWSDYGRLLEPSSFPATIALPATDQPTGTLQVRMRVGEYTHSSRFHGSLSVGYLTDINDSNSFVSVTTWSNNECWYNEEKCVMLTGAPDSARIALRSERTSVFYECFIDDLVVEAIPACPRPIAVRAIGSTVSSIDLAISGLIENYRVYWTDGTATDSLDVSDSVCTITGLNANTEYIISVVTRCSDGSITPPVYAHARTKCNVEAVPYFENFELYPYEEVPYCWTPLAGRPYIYQMSLGEPRSSKALMFEGAQQTHVALPRFDMPTDTLQVRFWLKPTIGYVSRAGTFSVGWQTNLADSSTFVEKANWSIANWDTLGFAHEVTVPMCGAPDSAYIVMRANVTAAGYWWVIDSLFVEPRPSCPPPTSLSVTGVGYDTIAVSFGGGCAGSYRLYISDDSLYSDTVSVVGVNNYTFTGLDTITRYTIRVASDCGDEVSDALVVRVFTEMPADTLPYYTGFEPGDDVAWRCLFSNSDNEWCIGSAVAATGSRSLYITDDGGASNHYSPGVQPNPHFSKSYAYKTFWLDAPAEYIVSYDWHSKGMLRVLLAPGSYEVNPDVAFPQLRAPEGWVYLDTGSSMSYSSTWRNYTQVFTVDAPGYYHLMFCWNSGNTPGTQPPAAIDNVRFERVPCPAVRNLIIDSIGRTSVRVHWQPYGGETYWEVAVGNTVNIVRDTFLWVGGLEPTTTYTATVRPVCGVGDTGLPASWWFTTGWCENATIMDNWDTSQEATFTDWSPLPSTGPFKYGYSQTIIPASNLTPDGSVIRAFAFQPSDINIGHGGTYIVRGVDVYMANVREDDLTGGFIHPDATHRFVKVISDGELSFRCDTSWLVHSFDSNFVWDGRSNVLLAVNRKLPVGRTANYIPSFNAHNDTVRRNIEVSSDSPIDINTVTANWVSPVIGNIRLISCPEGCGEPVVTDVVADDESITIHFESIDTVEVYITSGSWDDNVSGIRLPPTVGSYTFTGLTSMVYYYVGVRQVCNDSTFSEWVAYQVATLDLGCLPPTGFALGTTDYTSQAFSWTTAGGEAAWQLRVFNNFTNLMQTTATPSATVDGLYIGTTYRASVRSLCGSSGDIPGPWGDTLEFTTTDCPAVEGVVVGDISTSSATVNWQPVANSTGYRIYYGQYGFYDYEVDPIDVESSTTSYTMTGLDAGTDYEVYMLNRCADGVFSSVSLDQRIYFHTSVGIDAVENGAMSLSPNPANERVTLAVSGFDGAVEVQMIDLNGRVLDQWHTADERLDISLARYATGTYFVRVTSATQTVVRKLIIL